MAIQALTAVITPGNPHPFTFDQPVRQYMVGIREFDLHASRDHHVKTVSISLVSNHSPDNTITVQVNVELSDDRNRLSDNSKVGVTVLAVTEKSENKITLYNGSPHETVAIDDNDASQAQSALAGFSAQFDKDRHVQSLKASTGNKSAGVKKLEVTGEAKMVDSSGHDATGNVSVGLIATCGQATGLQMKPVTKLAQTGGVNLVFDEKYQHFAAFLTSFTCSFPGGNHHVKSIKAHISIAHNTITKTVIVTGGAALQDNHSRDNDSSSAAGFVVAY